jgi:hypothetical protein
MIDRAKGDNDGPAARCRQYHSFTQAIILSDRVVGVSTPALGKPDVLMAPSVAWRADAGQFPLP